jgi:methylthioribose-1-phosphate isomerase
MSEAIGRYGLKIIERAAAQNPGRAVNILTHCNAGWLATVDYGTALAPIYMAHDAGIALHVWVDETRPRGQGASLTAFELGSHGVPHAIVADNAGGHYMQKGMVDLVIVGTDRVTANGDVANKIGTYMVAVLAKRHGIPFYVAAPLSTVDMNCPTGEQIPIEERNIREITHVQDIQLAPDGIDVSNYAFDVTPNELVSAIITEKGVARAPYTESLKKQFED